MDLKLTEHVRNAISLLYKQKKQKQNKTKKPKKKKRKKKKTHTKKYKQTNKKQTNEQTKTGEISMFGTFLAKKSRLAYISLKIGVFRSAIMLYYVIVTSYVDRFS